MTMLKSPSAADPKALMPYLHLGMRSKSLASCTCSVGVSSSRSRLGVHAWDFSQTSFQPQLFKSFFQKIHEQIHHMQTPSIHHSPFVSRRIVHSRCSSVFPAKLGGVLRKSWRWQQARLATCLAPPSTQSAGPLLAPTLCNFGFPTACIIFPLRGVEYFVELLEDSVDHDPFCQLHQCLRQSYQPSLLQVCVSAGAGHILLTLRRLVTILTVILIAPLSFCVFLGLVNSSTNFVSLGAGSSMPNLRVFFSVFSSPLATPSPVGACLAPLMFQLLFFAKQLVPF